jgi:membrane protein implicated in regulation of membrane protease activity
MKPQRSYTWETVVIILSFLAVWVYFAAWIRAGRNETPLSPAWQLLLLPALVLLAVVFVRRVQRVMNSLRGESKSTSPHGKSTPTHFPPSQHGSHKK